MAEDNKKSKFKCSIIILIVSTFICFGLGSWMWYNVLPNPDNRLFNVDEAFMTILGAIFITMGIVYTITIGQTIIHYRKKKTFVAKSTEVECLCHRWEWQGNLIDSQDHVYEEQYICGICGTEKFVLL